MPRKCDSCIHQRSQSLQVNSKKITGYYCVNHRCASDEVKEMFPHRYGVPLDMARDICDREGDGNFVYFEPRDPSAGAAVKTAPEPKQMAKAA